MSDYSFKKNDSIDWAYDDSESVIHFKFGDARKSYSFTEEFRNDYPNFVKEYSRYFTKGDSVFTNPLAIVNYIEKHRLPVRLYSNMYDEEFEDFDACREWICNEHVPVYSSLDVVKVTA